MNNSTTKVPPTSKNALISYYFYSIEGAILIVTNGLILGTVLRYEVLRAKKQYLMIAALALADLWSSAGYFCAGIYRSRLILSGRDQTYVTAWYCMSTAHALLWSVGEQVCSNMLACISLDRLIAVSFPLQYFGFGRGYTLGLAGLFYLYSIIIGIISIFSTYTAPRISDKAAICFMGSAGAFADPDMSWFFWENFKFMSAASIVLFLLCILVYRKRALKFAPTTARELKEDQKQQRRFTVTLGLSTLCTLVFFVGMNEIITLLKTHYSALYFVLSPYMDNIRLLNPFTNIFLFTFRHKDIRKGMKYMFCCKPLTESALKTEAPPTLNKKEDTKKAKSVQNENVHCEDL